MTQQRSGPEAEKLVRHIVQTGRVIYARPHALERLTQRNMTIVDCENILRYGCVQEAEWENGKWRHPVLTGRMKLVVQILDDETLLVVTGMRL
jgi:hypothetical protein